MENLYQEIVYQDIVLADLRKEIQEEKLYSAKGQERLVFFFKREDEVICKLQRGITCLPMGFTYSDYLS